LGFTSLEDCCDPLYLWVTNLLFRRSPYMSPAVRPFDGVKKAVIAPPPPPHEVPSRFCSFAVLLCQLKNVDILQVICKLGMIDCLGSMLNVLQTIIKIDLNTSVFKFLKDEEDRRRKPHKK
jgi:hypothetical protein